MPRTSHLSLWSLTALLALLLSGVANAQEGSWTAKLGQEADSNPDRLNGPGSDADTATRISLSAEGAHRWNPRWRVDGQAFAAARFYRSATANDTTVVDASAGADWLPHRLVRARWSASARDTAERRNGRDYRSLGAAYRLRIGNRQIGGSVAVDGTHYVYKPDRAFEWHGWRVPVRLDARPAEGLSLAAGSSVGRRYFPFLLLGEEEVRRVDRVYSVFGSIRYRRGRAQASLQWSTEWLGSNEAGKDIVRHTFTPSVSVVPVGDLLVRLSARIQRGRCLEACTLIDEFERSDEETRNQLSVVLEHPLGPDWLWGEARYQRFSQSFEGASSEAFRRHVGMLGIAVRR